ncbi:hypothetical protein NKH18_41785 [Streptomyces sp. M10(2022)]
MFCAWSPTRWPTASFADMTVRRSSSWRSSVARLSARPESTGDSSSRPWTARYAALRTCSVHID